MVDRMMIGIGVVSTIVLMVGALWLWQAADELAMEWSRRTVAVWAARSLAVALGSAGQVVLLTLVVGQVYGGARGGPDRRSALRGSGAAWEEAVRLGAALVCVISLVSAVALGLAGR